VGAALPVIRPRRGEDTPMLQQLEAIESRHFQKAASVGLTLHLGIGNPTA